MKDVVKPAARNVIKEVIMKRKPDRLTSFLETFSRLKDPIEVIGIANLLHVPLLDDNKQPFDFLDIYAAIMEAYKNTSVKNQKFLLKTLNCIVNKD